MISKLMLIELKTLKQLVKNKSNIDVNKVKDILQLDPTLKVEMISDDTEIGKYGEWLLGKLYKKYNQLSENNKNTIKSDLLFYDYLVRSKRILPEYDNIYKIKSIEELNDIVISLQKNDNPLTQDPVTVAIGNHKFKTVSGNPFELLKRLYYDDIKDGGVTKWLVFNPKTKEESIVAGHGTSWCTSRDDEKNLWNTYIYEGNTAWIFLLSGKYKIDNPDEYNELVNKKLDKICIIVERGECKNRPDYQFELEKLPEIGKFIEDKIDSYEIKLENHDILSPIYTSGINDILTGINNKNNRLALMFKLTKEKLINLLKNRTIPLGNVIKLLEKNNIEIDKDIQLLLVSQGGMLIELILDAGIKPEYDVQLLLVSNAGLLISQIINAGVQPEDENEWHNIQMLLVSQNGYLIKHIIDAGIRPEYDVQMLLVSQNGYLIYYIIDAGIKPEYDVQLLLVTQDDYLIQYILDAGVQPEDENEWHNIQLLLVTNNGYLIEYIIKAGIKPNNDIQLLLVSEDGYLIKYIPNPPEEVQLLLIKQDVDLYGRIENPAPKLTLLFKKLKGIKESTGYISKLLDVN